MHCLDESDEEDCHKYKCPSIARKCANGIQCVEKQAICDDKIDCPDHSDELCTASCLEQKISGGNATIIRRCTEESKVCFPVERYCDGMADCPHGSDELHADCTCDGLNMGTFWLDMDSACI